jgi:hypothetical protein
MNVAVNDATQIAVVMLRSCGELKDCSLWLRSPKARLTSSLSSFLLVKNSRILEGECTRIGGAAHHGFWWVRDGRNMGLGRGAMFVLESEELPRSRIVEFFDWL